MKSLESWLPERTYRHSEFSDIKVLLTKKAELGVKISLCLPTLNEADTIAKEIVLLKSELMDRYPLLDEIAVIDSGSSDNTLEVAKSFGAKVFFWLQII